MTTVNKVHWWDHPYYNSGGPNPEDMTQWEQAKRAYANRPGGSERPNPDYTDWEEYSCYHPIASDLIGAQMLCLVVVLLPAGIIASPFVWAYNRIKL